MDWRGCPPARPRSSDHPEVRPLPPAPATRRPSPAAPATPPAPISGPRPRARVSLGPAAATAATGARDAGHRGVEAGRRHGPRGTEGAGGAPHLGRREWRMAVGSNEGRVRRGRPRAGAEVLSRDVDSRPGPPRTAAATPLTSASCHSAPGHPALPPARPHPGGE